MLNTLTEDKKEEKKETKKFVVVIPLELDERSDYNRVLEILNEKDIPSEPSRCLIFENGKGRVYGNRNDFGGANATLWVTILNSWCKYYRWVGWYKDRRPGWMW